MSEYVYYVYVRLLRPLAVGAREQRARVREEAGEA